MTKYKIIFANKAKKSLNKLDIKLKQKLMDKINSLVINPRRSGYLKLVGEIDLYRIRVGDYRIIYKIEDDKLIITIIKLGHRREIYL